MNEEKKISNSIEKKMRIIESVEEEKSIDSVIGNNQALLLLLDRCNEDELKKVRDFIDSIDQDPIFVAADQATCD